MGRRQYRAGAGPSTSSVLGPSYYPRLLTLCYARASAPDGRGPGELGEFMSGMRRRAGADPYGDESMRMIGARASSGLAFFLVCVTLGGAFYIARFTERRDWMLGFGGAFFILAGVCWASIRWRPRWSIETLIAFVNVIGIGLNAYHAVVGAPVAMCLWTL